MADGTLKTCPTCRGTRRFFGHVCPDCKGEGRVLKTDRDLETEGQINWLDTVEVPDGPDRA